MVGIRALSKIWLDGKLVPWDEAQTHVLSHGLHYGYAVFEGIRCHRTPTGSAVFRLTEHMDRFLNSAKVYRMRVPFDRSALEQACIDLVRSNGIPEAYIRPIAFTGYGEMGIDPTTSPVRVAIGMWEWGAYLGQDGVDRGCARRCRAGRGSIPGRCPRKRSVRRTTQTPLSPRWRPRREGYDEAILLNSAGMVAEGPGENIFRVKNGVVSTPPASSGILRGITRDTIIRFVADEGLVFQRTDFTREELFTADELLYTGTAAGVTPIREVDGRPIGTGELPDHTPPAASVRGRDPRARSPGTHPG